MAARETLGLHQRDLSRTPKPTPSVPVVREPELSADETTPARPVDEQEAKQSGWMRAAQAGDTDACRQLLTAIQPRIRAIVRSKIREEAAAEDVVQNALLSTVAGLSIAALVCLVGILALDLDVSSPPGADRMCFQNGAFFSLLPGGVVFHLSCDFLGPTHLMMGHLSIPFALGIVGLYPLGVLLRRSRR